VFPISFRDADGKWIGFAVDVLNEAARRENITLEWKATRNSQAAEEALRSGNIDLMPAGMVTPERERAFYVSAPWWSLETMLVSRADRRTISRVGITTVYSDLARKAFPSVQLVPYSASHRSLAAMCRGDIDGVLVAHSEVYDLLLQRPPECEAVQFVSGETSVTPQLALIARKSEQRLADRLRRRIDDMARDGTLMRMAVKNPPVSTAGVTQFEQRLRDRLNRRLWTVCGSLLALFLGWFLWYRQRDLVRTRRSASELRGVHAQLKEVNAELERMGRTTAMALDAAKSGAWEWNLETGELTWTESYRKLLGVPLTVKPSLELFYSLVHPDDQERLRKHVEESLRNRSAEFRAEFRISRPDGIHWLERRGQVIWSAEGKPVRSVGVTTDITEQKVLRGLLPTCAYCKKIRDEDSQWQQLEAYISSHTNARFSHGICPDCTAKALATEGLADERAPRHSA
jgi:ABC-type amino acid transport substrate-binding protein